MRTVDARPAILLAGLVAGLAAGCAPPPDAPESADLADYVSEYQQALVDSSQARAVEAEDAISACMTEQGFDYVPNPQGAWVSTTVTVERGPDWTAEHGYGIADGANLGTSQGTSPEFEDPNDAAYRAMSDAERAAWDAALRGDLDDPTDGCAGAVDPWTPLEDPEFQRWQEALGDIDARVPDDVVMQDALAGWVDCMADSGYPGFTARSDGYLSAAAAADETQGDAAGLPESARAELLADEIALATADLACDGSSGYSTAYDATTERLRAEFATEHRVELDAWRATWATPAPTTR